MMGYVGFSVQADAVGTSDRETAGILCSVMGKKLEPELACTAAWAHRSVFFLKLRKPALRRSL